MRFLVLIVIILWSPQIFAIHCDCEVYVLPPTSGPQSIPAKKLAVFEIHEFSSYSKKSQFLCRNLCGQEVEEKLSSSDLARQLKDYSASLVENKLIGYSCSGFTTLKYPIKVKAVLGNRGLGSVADFTQVVNYTHNCF
jgi:hypothetical protein